MSFARQFTVAETPLLKFCMAAAEAGPAAPIAGQSSSAPPRTALMSMDHQSEWWFY
jgi:hypothetical protein